MWAPRRSSLLRADTFSWSLGGSRWERSQQFLLLLGRAFCLGHAGCVPSGWAFQDSPSPLAGGRLRVFGTWPEVLFSAAEAPQAQS